MSSTALQELTLLFGDQVANEIYLNGQESIEHQGLRNDWYSDWVYYGRTGDNSRLLVPIDYKAVEVVDPQTFVEDPYYLNAKNILYPVVMQSFIEMNGEQYDELVLTGAIGTGKALDVATLIPTPQGWKLMGDLVAGDEVYDEVGKVCTVIMAHPIMHNRPCFELEFSDKSLIVADAEHLWETSTLSERTNRKKTLRSSKVRTTQQIHDTVLAGKGQANHSIPVAGAIVGKDCAFHCDPYALGAWLGDGSSDSNNFWCADPEIVEQIGKYHLIEKVGESYTDIKYHIRGFGATLRHLGVLGTKHIPEFCFRASYEQRLAMLQGLMDTDGTVDKRQGTCSFSQKNLSMALQVKHLVQTLGLQARLLKKKAGYGKSGMRVDCGYSYEVSFNPSKEFQVFRLPRKQAWVGIRDKGNRVLPSKVRYIKAVRKVEPRPVRCITVDSPSSLYLAGESFIPTHNTTLAIYTTAYQLYLLSMQRNPHQLLGLDPASEITFIFQSLNATLAKSVDYERFKTMIQKSPYFAENFAFDKNIESELKFPNRIIVKPVSGADTAAIGQNVIGGVIDEMNFMALVEKSKHSIDGTTYDQAMAVYNSISRRRKSRFMKGGVLPGKLCLVSSKRYPGQFTDIKEEESKREIALTGKTNIYVYDKRAWEIKPEGTFSGKWFNVFVGSEYKKARIIEEGDSILVDDLAYIVPVPEEYKTEFETDLMNALRDIAGVSTLATHPYMVNMDAVSSCFGTRESVLSREYANFVDLQLEVYPDNILDKEQPRFAHVDLGLTGDSAGVCVGYVDKFITSQRGGTIESMPHVNIDVILEVQPPRNDEILFYKIRDLFYALRSLGCNIRWITFDTFQSADSIQILRQQGFAAGVQSVDVSIVPYEITKQAFYDQRVSIPVNKKVMKELASLEKDVKKGKVDHPPNGSKDVSDALAGVVYGLTMRREIWGLHGVSPVNLPDSLKQAMDRSQEKVIEKK